MEASILTKKDYENITKIIKTTKSINKLYEKLLILETYNKKDSDEYNKYLEYLSIAIEVEESEYKSLNVNAKKYKELLEYVCKDIDMTLFYDDMGSLIYRDYKNKTIRRIVKKIKALIMNDEEYIYSNIPAGLMEILERYEIDDSNEYIVKLVRDTNEINNNIQSRFGMKFLNYVEKQKNNKDLSFYKDELVVLKYYLAFIDRSIEKYLRLNNFSVIDEINIPEELIISFLDKDKEIYSSIKKNFSWDMISEQIVELLNICDEDYKDPNVMMEVLIRYSLLQAGFSFTSNEELEVISDELTELLNSEDYIKIHSSDRISESIIKQAINRIYEDKGLEKEISKG